MSQINETVIGRISGRLNNLVFRKINGKIFVSIRPAQYKASKSDAALESRSNFAVTVKLAKAVNSEALLKKIRVLSKVKGTNSFQKII